VVKDLPTRFTDELYSAHFGVRHKERKCMELDDEGELAPVGPPDGDKNDD
jgi:hypothetical protein